MESEKDMSFTSNYIRCEGRELHYTEWGVQHAETVIAWHGLARTGRDMDDIAAHLSQRWRVICPDTIGRGLSQWSPAPEQEYCLDFYVKLATALVDALGIARFHWLGTSMGGAIGTLEATRFATGRINQLGWEINGDRGTLAFNLERLNELEVFEAGSRGFRTVVVSEPGDPHWDLWWPPGHGIGWDHTFVHELLHLLRAIAGETPVAPLGACRPHPCTDPT